MADDLSSIVRSLGRGVGRLKRSIDRRIGRTDQPQIVPYRGYGNASVAHVSGRVLLDPGLSPAGAEDVWWRNLINTYKRADSIELSGAQVAIRGFGSSTELKSDAEGFFRATLPVRTRPSDSLWQAVDLELLSPGASDGASARAVGNVMMPPADAEFGVISDLDDTVIRSDVHSLARMLKAVALGNAHTRLPFHGVAAFYEALHVGTRGQPVNPIFYVSSSPWNLYDLIEEFLSIRGIPSGPIVLRDWGLGVNPARNAPHKLAAIAHILDTYPALPFILIGDSSQEDPEIYGETMARYPGRIRAAYIRNVTPQPERSARIRALIAEVAAAGATMVLADDTLATARHAVEHGWISAQAIAAIQVDEAAEDAQAPAARPAAAPSTTLIVK